MLVFLLIVLGLVLPLAAGLLMNNYIFQSSGTGLPYLLISIGFLVLWAIIGFAARSRAGSTWKVVLVAYGRSFFTCPLLTSDSSSPSGHIGYLLRTSLPSFYWQQPVFWAVGSERGRCVDN